MADQLVIVENEDATRTAQASTTSTSEQMRRPLTIQAPGSVPRGPWSPPRRLVAGGIRSSVLTLASCALGTGPLALPYAMKSTGLGVGAFLLILSTGLAALGGDVLIRCAAEQQHQIKISSPRSMGNEDLRARQLAVRSWTYLLEMHFGPRASAILDVLLAFLGSGIIVMYLVFMTQFVGAFLSNVGLTSIPSRETLIAICACASFPLSLPGSIGQMRFMAAWVYLVLIALCLLTSVGLATCEHSSSRVEYVNLSLSGTLSAFCLFFFAQMYHFNLYTIFAGLEGPYEWSPNYGLERSLADIVRMRKIIRLTATATILICSVTSVTGYVAWRSDTNQNIILNFDPSKCAPGTMAVTLCLQVLLSLNTLVSIPLNVVPTRVSILRLVGLVVSSRVAETLESRPFRYLLTLVMITTFALIAMLLTAVAEIISFLSGSIGTVIAFLLPLIFYKKSNVNMDMPLTRLLVLFILGLATLAGFANVIVLLVSKVVGK